MSSGGEEIQWSLPVYGVAMFLGAFGLGLIPFAFKSKPSMLAPITTFGIGVLVGCALIIIIPEGVKTLMESDCAGSSTSSQNGDLVGPSLVAGFALMLLIDQLFIGEAGHGHSHGHEHEEYELESSKWDRESGDASVSPLSQNKYNPNSTNTPIELKGLVNRVTSSTDAIDSYASTNAEFESFESQGLLGTGSEETDLHLPSDEEVVDNDYTGGEVAVMNPFLSMFGLLVHSAVDGLALGAISASGTHQSLELIVFLAIMLHKGPAAFGVSSVLLKQKVPEKKVQLYLFVFSLCAPVMALVTYFLLVLFPVTAEGSDIGICLLFSGGTVLYTISVHILPTIMSGSDSDSVTKRRQDVGLLLMGMLIPLMFGDDD